MTNIQRKNRWSQYVFATTLLACCYVESSYAYEASTTHPTITGIAVERSKVVTNPGLLPSIGLRPLGQNLLPPTLGSSDRLSVLELVRLGVVEEDHIGASGIRVLYHFFDPQNNRGLIVDGTEYEISPDWALEDDGVAQGTAQGWSYFDARRAYYAALTAASPSQREEWFGYTFKALGHVVHHIQDMGQPQHVRNEIHCNARIGCGWVLEFFIDDVLYRPSEYEEYVGLQDQRISSGSVSTAYPNPSSNTFREPRDYWVNPLVPNGGMAEFTATNFITPHSALRWNPARNQFQAIPGFPLPDGSDMQITFAACTASGSKGQVSGVCGAVESSLLDPVTNNTSIYKVASLSTLYFPLTSALLANNAGDQFVGGIFDYDQSVFESQMGVLIPRAVGFSTGLIDYFFRGNINMAFDPGGSTWRVRNWGAEDVEGRFWLYSDDASGQRTRVTTSGWADGLSLNLAPGQSSQSIPFSAPANNGGNFMLVFDGRMGNEGRAGVNNVNAVAGKVVSVPHVTINYGDNGPVLDDLFELMIDGVVVSSMSVPTSQITVGRTLAPGTHTASLRYIADVVGEDDGGTYFISFSSNVQGLCCSPLSGVTGGPGTSGTIITWQFTVQ